MSKKRQFDYTPVAGYLLLDPIEGDTSSSRIKIQDGDELPQRALVIAVGKPAYYAGTNNIFKSPCKVGDEVIHSGFGFEYVKVGGHKFRLCPFEKILAVGK